MLTPGSYFAYLPEKSYYLHADMMFSVTVSYLFFLCCYFQVYLTDYSRTSSVLMSRVCVCLYRGGSSCGWIIMRVCVCGEICVFLPQFSGNRSSRLTTGTHTEENSTLLCVCVFVCVMVCKGNNILRTAFQPPSLCHFLFSALVLVSLCCIWPWPLGPLRGGQGGQLNATGINYISY